MSKPLRIVISWTAPAAILLAVISSAFGQGDWQQMNDFVPAPNNQLPLSSPDSTPDRIDTETDEPLTEAVDLEVLEGREIMESKCSSCHAAPRPDKHTLKEWPAVLSDMGPRAMLGARDYQLIMTYLEHSLQSPRGRMEWDEPEQMEPRSAEPAADASNGAESSSEELETEPTGTPDDAEPPDTTDQASPSTQENE